MHRQSGDSRRELHDIEHATERAAELDAALATARIGVSRVAGDALDRRRAAAEGVLEGPREGAGGPRDGDDALRGAIRADAIEARRGWSERGLDEAEFYISPNPGEDVKPLARIASGGELSRIMLALKTLASTDAPGKTLIFDEVDAGIGGAVADVVGARLQRLAASGSRCSASRTCRRSPRTARRTSASRRA